MNTTLLCYVLCSFMMFGFAMGAYTAKSSEAHKTTENLCCAFLAAVFWPCLVVLAVLAYTVRKQP